jgi:hypothetical protein
MSSQVKKSGQCVVSDKNHQYFQLFHCQQTQSLLITLYKKLVSKDLAALIL